MAPAHSNGHLRASEPFIALVDAPSSDPAALSPALITFEASPALNGLGLVGLAAQTPSVT